MVVVGMIDGFLSPTPLRPGRAKAELARRAAERAIVEIVRTNSLPSFLRRRRRRLRLRLLGRLAAHLNQGSGLTLRLDHCSRRAADHLGPKAPAGDDLHGEVDR